MRKNRFYEIKCYTSSFQELLTTLLKIKVNGFRIIACAGTGESGSIDGEVLCCHLRYHGCTKIGINTALVAGFQTEVYKILEDIKIKGRKIQTMIFAIPGANDRHNLLGIYFV